MRHALAAALLVVSAAPGLAQEAPPRAPRPPRAQEAVPKAPAPVPGPVYDSNASETQQRLQEVLRGYPPSIGQVLALDPTLLTNQSYLEPYPTLSTFLAQHPEIAHNPGYFLPQFRDVRRGGYDYNDPRLVAMRSVNDALFGVAFLIGFLTVVATIGWLLRTVIEHRKWLRVSKTHAETHTKLLDRLTSNEDLLAYMQSPAGERFLNAAPIPLDAGPRTLSAPFGRILWSVQAGVVIACLGAALLYASRRFAANEIFSQGELPLFLMGAAAVAVGFGFVISSFVAYGLSRRLGLFPTTLEQGTGSNQ
jgi:hypothetical protein